MGLPSEDMESRISDDERVFTRIMGRIRVIGIENLN